MEQETLDNSPAQFLTNLLTIQCLLLQANEGAILRLSSDKKVEVLTLYSPSNGKPAWIVQSVESITKALSTDNVIVTPHASLNILTIRLNMNDLNKAGKPYRNTILTAWKAGRFETVPTGYGDPFHDQ